MSDARALALSLLTLLILLVPGRAAAQQLEASANVGWVSEYLYRGISQNTSSASAGLDASMGNLYLGTWAADVGAGTEVDLYGGVELERSGVVLSAGGTGYLYTGDFDDTYLEGNVAAGYGPLTLELARGRYFTEPGTQDYTFSKVTLGTGGAHASLGVFGGDFAGRYGEVGYGFLVGEVDLALAWIFSDSELAMLPSGRSNATLVLGMSKTFTLR